ncbi:MAG: hypothetical protein A2W33_07565 [Chloroflexi bacterium RBG_16_52_11]|nr:MAG: hypothetical protein A2W33_07565 [Chloroflexi bacterium RBG_16_52_11]
MSDQSASPEITSDDRLWAALGYIFSPLVPIIILLIEDKRSRPFLKYHSVQSLAVGIVFFIIVAVLSVFTFGCISLIWLIMFYWAYTAYKGEYTKIPFVSDFIKKQGWA